MNSAKNIFVKTGTRTGKTEGGRQKNHEENLFFCVLGDISMHLAIALLLNNQKMNIGQKLQLRK
jgi:hypothetical protein